MSHEPAPNVAAAVRLDAKLALRTLLDDSLRLLRELSTEGNLFGVIFMKLFRGFGGDQTCQSISPDCRCQPDIANPFQATTLAFDVSISFSSGGVDYTADFSCPWKLETVRGTCAETV